MGAVQNVYSSGGITGIDYIGGVGGSNSGIVSNEYYNKDFIDSEFGEGSSRKTRN